MGYAPCRISQKHLSHYANPDWLVIATKSLLVPAQNIIFLGLALDSVCFTACLSADRVNTLESCLTLFRLLRSIPFRLCLSSPSAVCT
ncbi:hypothetical protein GOODEAATRI_028749 [Goodea atripinnis]|uniref:Uncharacterized protein n=1 Tax=Goodea atripinnis TaxID=208336 RepID=A0ABV0NYS2_9TELE